MRPYKCPICLGRGTVPESFYYTPIVYKTIDGTSTTPTDTTTTWASYSYTSEVECRTCKGKGVLWSHDYDPHYPAHPWYVL